MRRLSFIAFAAAFSLGVAWGQTVTGTILGIVSDATGGSVPQAKVTITNENTGQKREVSTDAQGVYQASFLPVGVYTVSVEKGGFRTAAFQGLVVQVDQQIRLNVSLEVGSVAQEVTVIGTAPLLATENASMGDVVDAMKVVTLPLNGRNFLQLVQLSPGVNTGAVGGDGLAINGGRGDYNGYLVDGTTNYNRFAGSAVYRPNVDAIEEFKVQTSTYSAEFGFAGNGQINLVTKGGTNAFHGSAYEFLRNSSLDARNFFDPPGRPKTAFRRNQFGATFGGPIRRDKTFFFGDFEGIRFRRSSTIRSRVPTQPLKAGDFTGERPIFDVLTYSAATNSVLQFPGNQIPRNRISPVADGLNQYYPEPNLTDPNLNFINTRSSATDNEAFGVRVDHQLFTNNHLSVRYGYNNEEGFSPAALPVLGTFNSPRAQLVSIADTHLVSPTIINELRLGFNRLRASTTTERTNKDDIANRLGIGGVSTDPLDYGFPNVSIIPNYTGVSDPSNPFPTFRWENVYSVGDTVSIVRGKHAFKLGAQVQRIQMNGVQNSHGRGTFEFDGRFTRSPADTRNTGHEFADYMLGYASRTQRQTGSTRVDMRSTYFGAFFQNDWKVNPRLTLNMGVRYEVNTPLGDIYGRNSNVDYSYFTYQAAVVQAGDIGPVTGRRYNNAMYEQDSNNWAPRFGFAYRPFGENTVIRSGYGIFYALARGQLFSFNAQNPPRIVNETFTANFPNADLTFTDGFNLGALVPPGILSVRAVQPDRRDAYVQQWDFTIQQKIAGDLMVEAAYVGTKGTKLARSDLPNIPRPGPGAIQPRRPFQGMSTFFVREARVSSIYHAFQFKVDKRWRSGLTLFTAYTFGKSIDDGSSSFGGGGNSSDNAQDPWNHRADRGRSAHDARQRLVLSYIYELPFGAGKPFASGARGVVQHIIGGWQVAGITMFQTGLSNTVRTQADVCNCDRSGSRMRADATGIPWKLDNPTPERFWNTAAFRVPQQYTFGNSGRGVLDNPGINNFDLSLMKNFRLFEAHSLQFRAEFFNAWNHPQFNAPNFNVDNVNFGRITSARPERQIQLGLRYEF